MSAEVYIRENVKGICNKVYIAPNIPEKKLNNAIESVAKGENPDYVVAILDTTLLGSAKEGCVLFGDKMFIKPMLEKAKEYKFKDISNIEFIYEEVKKKNDKIDIKEKLIVNFDDGRKEKLDSLIGLNYKKFEEFINEMLNQEGEDKNFTSNSQVLPLANMDNSIKLAYLKIICNFVYQSSDNITALEYSEIISLTARINLDKKERLELRSYMCSISEKEDDGLIKYLQTNISESSFDILKKSLIKDILYIQRVRDKENISQNDFLNKIKDKLKIKDEEIDLMLDAIKNDEDIIKLRMNDSQIIKSFKELISKAGAIGVPMAAIYFSGSIVGLSAAGITSGLAALGMGGILGFSSMATGIGSLVVLGVFTYKGIKKATGINEIENNKQRELMLQAIIRNSQQALNYLIEDVNEITQQLISALEKEEMNSKKVKKLSLMIEMLSKGAKSTTNKINYAELEIIISKVPKTLDLVRLEELTNEPTKLKLREYVLNCYQERELILNNEESKYEYVLKNELVINELEELSSIFNGIGYNNVKDAALASAKGFAKSIKDGIIKGN
ncbi:hypothetical protein [Paraclostridium bifermentans]|uniref:hypothetical protein n=1 Tax=Paraclostridium bifermentans TaxID=1490 RepID=UPI0018AB2497|nr:hypothetical protein [Paraclostridium bifermentans]